MMAKDAGAEMFRLTAEGFEIRFPVNDVPAPSTPVIGRVVPAPGVPVKDGTPDPLEKPRDNYDLLFGGNKPKLLQK